MSSKVLTQQPSVLVKKKKKSLKKQLKTVSEDDRIIELSLEGDRYKGNEKKFQKSIDKTLKK